MSTLGAFGFHTQKHAEQQQHVQKQQQQKQLKNNKLTTFRNTTHTAPVSTSSSSTTNVPSQITCVPWLLSPTTDSPSKSSFVTIDKNQNQTLKTIIPSNTMSTRKPKKSKGKTTTKKTSGSTTITQFFAPQKQNKNIAMEIDEKGKEQAVVRKQICFEELWQRLVKEYSNNNNNNDCQQDNNNNNNNNNNNKSFKCINRRRKHDEEEEQNECCAVVPRQANKKTKFTVDHEFLLKFQQLLTVNNPTLYNIPLVLDDNDNKGQEEQTVIVTIRRQLTVNESMDLFNQIANELLLL
ncbi:hypothetical protein BDC45DRAFT_572898 [Circinella umbellata]|nr:hypothetical protein BDC45DRAFT_572898 [Circinella umbellata]